MDISGKLSLILPVQTGEGKNGTWQKGGFVIETSTEKFPKKICFVTWSDTIAQVNALQIGENVKVYFDLESREYMGKWFSDIKAWKVERLSGGTPVQEPTMKYSTGPSNPPPAGDSPVKPPAEDDDLPF